MNIETEFETLRQEIMSWQTRRFTVLGTTVVVITAIISWVIKEPSSWSWDKASILVLIILITSSLLTEYFGFYNGERSHQALAYMTPNEVYLTREGGGAKIVDHFSNKQDSSIEEVGQRQSVATELILS